MQVSLSLKEVVVPNLFPYEHVVINICMLTDKQKMNVKFTRLI